MSLRLRLLNLGLRLLVKPKLRRMNEPPDLRESLERDASRFFATPDDANFVADLIRRPGRPAKVGMIEALWASRGRPDRRRVILYFHGGAYIAGSHRTHKHLAAALAGAAGVRAIIPDYRLAPNHPFPAAVEDAVSAYQHLLAAGYDASEIAIAGDSAGGGLGLALLLKLRDEDLPRPACYVGFSPWADLSGESETLVSNASRDVMLPISRMNDATGFVLNGHDPKDPLASPVFGEWSDPPPAILFASRHEVLLGDAKRMAEVLRAAGGDVTLELWRHTPHAWPIFVGRLPEADQAVATAGAFIARHLCAQPE
ncbi:MAG: alpha/beta hydrolase fold domain-containing protein [Pseudomonadota bacterium]